MSVSSGRIDGAIHFYPVRVYYEDTDAVGIVYHSNYLKYAERARTEMLRLAGVNQSEMATRYGMNFAVRDCTVQFRRPARLDDIIEVRSRLIELGGASITAEQAICREAEELARLVLRVACLRPDGRATRIPDPVRAALTPYTGSQE